MKSLPIRSISEPKVSDQLRLILRALILATIGLALSTLFYVVYHGGFNIEFVVPLMFTFSGFSLFVPALGYFFGTTNSSILTLVAPSMWLMTIVLILLNSVMGFHKRTINGLSASAFVQAGLFEEAIKMVCYLIPLFSGKIDHVYNLFFSAGVAGIAFGVFENAHHAVNTDNPLGTAVARYALTTSLHMSLCLIGASFIAYNKTGVLLSSLRIWFVYLLALVVPMLVHGLYDELLFLAEFHSQYLCLKDVAIFVAILINMSPFIMMIPIRRATESSRTHVLCDTTYSSPSDCVLVV